jgi:hypothetical protein
MNKKSQINPVKEPVLIEKIEGLTFCNEKGNNNVKVNLDKFFADSNASMMGGWT